MENIWVSPGDRQGLAGNEQRLKPLRRPEVDDMAQVCSVGVAVVGGYLAGSISPAYFITRWLKGIDIRTVGRGHAGASNVFLNVSAAAGIITAVIDLVKGAAVVLACLYLLSAPLALAYLGGLTAVAGHVFPFYLRFKGGWGAATSTGILLLSIYWLIAADPYYFIPELVLMAFVVASTIFITRNDYLLSLVALPLLAYFILLRYYPRLEAVVAGMIMGYIFAISLIQLARHHRFRFLQPENPAFWSAVIKVVLLIFLILVVQFPAERPFLAPLAASVLLLLLDTVRLKSKDPHHFTILKKLACFLYLANGETGFSALTLFCLGASFTALFFSRWSLNLVVAAVSFLVTGDLVEQMVEPLYGHTALLVGSLEGSLGHLTACSVIGYILHAYLGISTAALVVGAITATLVKQLPLRGLNRIAVPVASALAMLISAGGSGL